MVITDVCPHEVGSTVIRSIARPWQVQQSALPELGSTPISAPNDEAICHLNCADRESKWFSKECLCCFDTVHWTITCKNIPGPATFGDHSGDNRSMAANPHELENGQQNSCVCVMNNDHTIQPLHFWLSLSCMASSASVMTKSRLPS